jgi:hypothetical protein
MFWYKKIILSRKKKGGIDLVARKGKFRVALESDHHKLIK